MVTIRKTTADEATMRKDETWYMVEKDGQPVGRIIKIRNTRSNIYPWCVYRIPEGVAIARFYEDKDAAKIGPAFDYETCKTGGKTAAFVFARRTFA